MKTLTSKIVRAGIKNGMTLDDFCIKYDIKDENDFLQRLEKAFPKAGAEQALRDIRRNEKLIHKDKAKIDTTSKDVAVPEVTVVSEDVAAMLEKTTTASRKEGDAMEMETLEVLKLTEASLSSEVIDLENQHKELATKRRDCLQKLRSVQQKVDELVAELETQQSVYEETATKANEIIKQMNQISEARTGKLTELTAVREQITRLETTIIAVYDDCSFEVVEGIEISLDAEEGEVSNLSHSLMEEELCEDLTIKQIKTLSRLLLLSHKNPTQKIEFIFDSDSLEQAYLASKPLLSL